jgi:predicted MPP superfamily phosphohydrolase
LLELVAGFLVAVALCGAFVRFYNRVLARMHESTLKKVVALSLLPAGVMLGGIAAWRLGAGGNGERVAWLALAIAGLPVTAAAARDWLCERRLLRGSLLHPLGRFRDGIPWSDFALWQKLILLPLVPFNRVCDLRVHHRVVEVPGLGSAFDGYRIVHLTDLHFHRTLSAAWYRHVVAQAVKLRPDLLLYGGDFLSKIAWVDRIPEFLQGLEAPDGVLYVRGNHDFWKSPQRIRRHARRAGMRLLSNRGAVIRRGRDTLAIVGIESPYIPLTATDRALLRRLPGPKVGLVHDPVAFGEALSAGCTVALAGHTHGGQVRLPLFGTTISGSACRRGLAHGVGRLGRMLTITSNGQGAFFPVRFGAPPEIILVELRATSRAE